MCWAEVADGVYQRRYESLDVNVCVVRGADGLLVIDTRSSHREADEIRADLRAFGPATARWVVNTHAHYDHTFGNHRFGASSDLGLPIYGHERVPAHLDRYERRMLADWIARGEEPIDDWREVVITPPTVLVGDHTELDLGGRVVELVHLGRGHTDNDLLIYASDADAWVTGDLVEVSGPPMYGSGSCPLDWPATLDALVSRLGDGTVVVPGHGEAVGRRKFVASQSAELRVVADVIRELFAAGVQVEDAVAAGADRWPYPSSVVAHAVADGYAALRAPT